MRKLDTSSIIQLVTTLSVIIGITLVIYELRQTRDLADAELRAQALVHGMDLKSGLVAEHGMEALGKACLEQELTIQELFTLDTYYRAIYDQINYFRIIDRTFGADWEEYAIGQFERSIFVSQNGREWWASAIEWIPPEVRDIGNSTLNGMGPSSCGVDMKLRYSALAA